jgi:hypothetical protein
LERQVVGAKPVLEIDGALHLEGEIGPEIASNVHFEIAPIVVRYGDRGSSRPSLPRIRSAAHSY